MNAYLSVVKNKFGYLFFLLSILYVYILRNCQDTEAARFFIKVDLNSKGTHELKPRKVVVACWLIGLGISGQLYCYVIILVNISELGKQKRVPGFGSTINTRS